LTNEDSQVTEILSVNQLSKIQGIFDDISRHQNDEYFDDAIKFNRFDLAFNDGVFVNLSFTILETESRRHSKYYQLISTGELIETRGFEVADSQYISSELVYKFFETVDNTKLLDVLNIDKNKNINFIYMGKVSLTEEDIHKKDVYIIKSNKLEVLAYNHLNLEKEYCMFQVITNNRVIYIAI
jgi:hypothetical protein